MTCKILGIAMTCENCGTIKRYGKRVSTGRKLCIDCWKLKDTKRTKTDTNTEKESK